MPRHHLLFYCTAVSLAIPVSFAKWAAWGAGCTPFGGLFRRGFGDTRARVCATVARACRHQLHAAWCKSRVDETGKSLALRIARARESSVVAGDAAAQHCAHAVELCIYLCTKYPCTYAWPHAHESIFKYLLSM